MLAHNTQLMENEKVIYEGKVKRFFSAHLAIAVVGLVIAIAGGHGFGGFLIVSAGIGFISNFIKYKSSVFAITNKRVIIRVGVLNHRSLELNLTKVESVFVQSGLLDRLNKMGTLVVVGTGGTKEFFKELEDPNTFKLKLQEQLDTATSSHKMA